MQPSTERRVERTAAARLGSGTRPLVYLAEDDDELRDALAEMLAQDGFTVRAAPDGTVLFEWLFRERREAQRLPDLIVTDHRMPGYCALDILECLVEVRWTIPVIVITAYGPELRGMATALGAYEVFEKPFDPDALRRSALDCIDPKFPHPAWQRGPFAGRTRSGED